MTFRIRGNRLAGIPAHGDLMRLDKTDLAILIKYSESISLRLENDADCLCAESQSSDIHTIEQESKTYSSWTRS